MRSVKKTSSSVLTSNPGLAYKPAIETAPPVSGASSALPEEAGADVRVTGRVPVGIPEGRRCLTIEDRKRNVDGGVLADLPSGKSNETSVCCV